MSFVDIGLKLWDKNYEIVCVFFCSVYLRPEELTICGVEDRESSGGN